MEEVVDDLGKKWGPRESRQVLEYAGWDGPEFGFKNDVTGLSTCFLGHIVLVN